MTLGQLREALDALALLIEDPDAAEVQPRQPLASFTPTSSLGSVRGPRRLPKLTVTVALLVAGCGGGELPATDAEAMLRDLGKVEQGVRAGECKATRPTLRRLDRNIAALPNDVDPELRTSLDRGVEHLGRLVGQECKQREPDPVVTEPEPITPPPVQTTPEPAPTVTEPPPETEEQQEEPKPEEPKDEEPEEPKDEEPKEPKEPKVDKPTEEDICGENPAPTC